MCLPGSVAPGCVWGLYILGVLYQTITEVILYFTRTLIIMCMFYLYAANYIMIFSVNVQRSSVGNAKLQLSCN